MTDEQSTQVVSSWLKDSDDPAPDPSKIVCRAMGRVRETRQVRRWWPLPAFGRRISSTPSTSDREQRFAATPDMTYRFPAVTRRTQTMFSPVKAITAGALVFAIGGVMFVVQPFGQQGEGVPAAETPDLVEPVEFTVVLEQGPYQGERATCELVDGVNHCRDARPSVVVTEASDPRMDGQVTWSVSQIQYPDHPWFETVAIRIYNSGGAWQGSASTGGGPVPLVLVGEGDYDGLYAFVNPEESGVISGIIYPHAPLEATDLSPLATD